MSDVGRRRRKAETIAARRLFRVKPDRDSALCDHAGLLTSGASAPALSNTSRRRRWFH